MAIVIKIVIILLKLRVDHVSLLLSWSFSHRALRRRKKTRGVECVAGFRSTGVPSKLDHRHKIAGHVPTLNLRLPICKMMLLALDLVI